MADPLAFQAIPDLDMLNGAVGWQARRGPFVFTIAGHAEMPEGLEIAVTFRPDHFSLGPFRTLAQAIEACNRAANTLKG